MKRFLVIFILLAVALMALPGYIGFQAEARYQEMLAQFERGGLQLAEGDYQRGWFGAQASNRVQLVVPANPPSGQGSEIGFTLVSDISHGPLTGSGLGLAQIVSRVEWDEQPAPGEDYRADITTLVSLDGAGSTQIELPALKLPAQAGRPAVEFAGISGQVRFSGQFDQVEADATMPGLTLSEGAGKRFEIGRVKLQSSSRRGVSDLMLGGAEVTIDSLALLDEVQGTRFSTEALGMQIESSAEGDRVAANARYHLQALVVDDQAYGPAELKVALRRLPAALLGKIQKSMEEINAQRLPQQQRGMAVATLLLSSGPELVQADPHFEIDRLHVVTPQGAIDGRLSIRSQGLQWADIADTGKVIEKLLLEARLSMPEYYYRLAFSQKLKGDILRQLQQRKLMGQEIEMPKPMQLQAMADQLADQQLQQLLSQDFLLREGNLLTTDVSMQDGLLSVNGKAIPLPVNR